MGKIVLLDELTINQIAAGEVIERPASVIKEMVENSIDAGATNITVEIKNGGISYIRITDNGKGIAKDDIELAFERHATSKIRSATDLEDVKSMGFRGEALASIAAISNVELVSKTAEDMIGTKIIVEGGNILNIEETGCSKGTSITVRNLFYNTPVRYKFLKKDFTETGYIEDVVTRIALVHPEIAIKLISSGKTIIQTNGSGELKSVIYSIYGKDIAEEIIPVSYEYEYIKINGVIGKPAIARSNRSNQLFFVNQRYIKDKTLTAGAEQAFKGLLPIGKFGFLVLNLEMSPNKVDVNVHPAKLEVRFEEESVAFKAVYHAIKNTLLSSDLISDREKNKAAKEASKDAFKIQNTENTIKEVAETRNRGLFGQNIKNEDKEEKNKNDIDIFERISKLRNELKKQMGETTQVNNVEEYKQIGKRYKEIVDETNNISKELENKINEDTKKQESVQEHNENEIQIENVENSQIHDFQVNQITDIQETQLEEVQDNAEQIIEKMTEKIYELKQNEEIKDAETNETQDKEIKKNNIEEESQDSQIQDNQEDKKDLSFEKIYKDLFGKEPYGGKKIEEPKKEEDIYTIQSEELSDNMSVFEEIEEYNKPVYKFIGIAFKTYIILEMNKELYIMDQHAAHERILYEKVKANFYNDEQKDCQLLLLPDIITLTTKEMNIAKDNMKLFEKAGFMVEEFGDNTIKLSGVPEICVDLETKELFMETLDEINTVARTAKQEKEEKFIATVACKAAVKANMALTEEEVTSLMEELLKLPNPFSCPHGRPTVIKMSKYDIERKFARK